METHDMTLRDLRMAKGLSQGDLARQIGVSQQYISKVEKGASLGPRAVRTFADGLGTSTDVIYSAWINSRRNEYAIAV